MLLTGWGPLAARHRAWSLVATLALLATATILALGLFTPAGLAALALTALIVPLLAGWRAHALDAAARGQPTAHRPPPVAPLEWFGAGYQLPFLLARDLLAPRPNVRLDVELGELAQALADAGAASEAAGRARLDVVLPEDGGRVTVRRVPRAFPRGARALAVRGEPAAVQRAIVLLESLPVGHACWSAAGRRFEARLHALLRDVPRAHTLEERSLLAEDAQRLERILDARDLPRDEWTILRAWHAQRLRVLVATRLLSEPVGVKPEGRVLAPAPALAPDLARVLDAGGLALLRRAVFVPHWVLPIRTRGREVEVVVNALTHKPLAGDARAALLSSATERPPAFFLDAPRSVTFLPAPEPTAAVLRELRDAFPGADVAPSVGAPCEWLLVPYVPTSEGYVNAVTGEKAPDLGAPAGVASAARASA